MKTRLSSSVAALALALCLAPFALVRPAGAQTTPAVPAPAPVAGTNAGSGDVVTLSPFTVNEQANSEGYHTNDTTSGSLMATALNDLPLTIDVINRNFIDDASLTSVADAVRYVPGVSQMQKNEYDTENFAIRGFATNDEFRNGIFFHGITDETNIESAEVVKGPAAILYGIVQPGGIVNYITKQPFNTPTTTVKYEYGSYDYSKLDIDLNAPLASGNTLLFRMPMSVTTGNSYIKYEHTNAQFLNPVLVYNPNPSTSITFDYTYRRDTGTWNRGGNVAIQGVDAEGNIIENPREVTPSYTAYQDVNPYEYGEVGPSDSSNREHTYAEVIVEHRFGEDVNLRVEASQENLRMTDTGSFDEVQNSPAYVGVPLNLIPVSGLVWDNSPFLEQVKEIQRHFEIDAFWKHDFGVLQNKLILGSQGQEAPVNVVNFFWPGAVANVPLSSPDSVRFARGNIASYTPWFSFQDPITTSLPPSWSQPDFYLTDQIAGLNNRLHVLIGARDQEFSDIGTRKIVPQGGVVYAIIPEVSAYATYSSADQSNGITAAGPLVGTARPTETAKDFDAGLKMNFLDHRLNATLDYYNITEDNVAYSDLTSFLNPNGTLKNQDTELVSGQDTSKGVEAQLDYAPIANLQFTVGYSHDIAVDAVDGPIDQGARLPGAIKDSLTFLGKYTIPTGADSGFDIGGGGVLAFHNIYYYLPASASYLAAIQYGGYRNYMAFAHYHLKLFGKKVQLGITVKNLTNAHYYSADYTVADPREVFGEVSVQF
jgi:iron complex outermembrane receptor protein